MKPESSGSARSVRAGSEESDSSTENDSQHAESPLGEEFDSENEGDAQSNPSRSRSTTPTVCDSRDRLIEALQAENAKLKKQLCELIEHIKMLKHEAARTKKEAEERAAEAKSEAEQRHRELLQALTGKHSAVQEKAIEAIAAPIVEKSTTTTEAMVVEDDFQIVRRKRKETTPEKNVEQQQPPKKLARPQTPKKVVSAPSTSVKAPERGAAAVTKEAVTKKEHIPPVILRKQERWSMVSQRLAAAVIKYTKARLVQGTIQITPATPDDHRKMTRLLESLKEEYHTYSLPDEKQLRIVIRGLPTSISNDEIKADLEQQGYAPTEVLRMTSRKTKTSMPLVLVKLPKEQTSILEVNRCCYLVVRVELQRKEAHRITQCYRCQSFGHAQSYCTAMHRCVKCGEQHASSSCQLSREQPATCANCAGAHPASYGGCPKNPKPAAKKKCKKC